MRIVRFFVVASLCSGALALTACAAQSADAGPGQALPPGATPAAAAGASSSAGASAPPVAAGAVPQAAATITAQPADSCSPSRLATISPGTLTIAMAAGLPAPWLVGAGPAAGQGIDPSAVGAIAARLGFDQAAVRWVAPGLPSDASIGVFTSADARGAQVSSGYAPIDDVVVMRAGAASVPGPTAFVRGTSGESSVQRIATAGTVGVASSGEALAGVRSGSYAAAVVPLAALADPQVAPGLAAVARIAPAGKYQPEQARLLLPATSPIAACVNGAIDRLRVEGVLDQLYRQWVTLPDAGPAK